MDMILTDPVLYVNASSVSNPRLLEVTFRSINYVPTTFDIPWYVSLVDDIRSYFENLTIEVMGIIDSLDIYWENFFDRWDSRWDNLMIKLEEYFGEDGELAEKGDAMSEQAEQMQQANDAMSSVEKPSVDTGAMLDQYLNFNPSALALLAVFTNNAFVTPMLVVIFTFALCGYIFFGKRR